MTIQEKAMIDFARDELMIMIKSLETPAVRRELKK